MKKILFIALLAIISPKVALSTPSTPSNFEVTSVTTSSITINFDDNTDEDTDQYCVYYDKSSSAFYNSMCFDQSDYSSKVPFTIYGLESDTLYYIKVSAFDGDKSSQSDTSTISKRTSELGLSAEITDDNEITLTIDDNNSVSGHNVYWGKTSETSTSTYTNSYDVGDDTTFVISNLDDATYYFRTESYDSSGDVLQTSEEISITNGDASTLLNNEEIENGCFINTCTNDYETSYFLTLFLFFVTIIWFLGYKKNSFKFLLLIFTVSIIAANFSYAEEQNNYKNIIYIKGGYFVPSDSDMKDIYEKNILSSISYEREIASLFSFSALRNTVNINLSTDFSLGYMKSNGYAIMSSTGESTKIDTSLQLAPASASLNLNMEVSPFVTFFTGLGPDYLYYKEEFSGNNSEGNLSGWHGKAGFKLFSEDIDMKYRPGIIIEAEYNKFDRMGKNDIDLGGMSYNIGLMYRF